MLTSWNRRGCRIGSVVSSRAEEVAPETAEGQRTDEELKAEIDTLLDEIDQVLEENAVEVLLSYRQISGE
jgi:ubiquitin-like protein Pup